MLYRKQWARFYDHIYSSKCNDNDNDTDSTHASHATENTAHAPRNFFKLQFANKGIDAVDISNIL